ncbi:DUF2142 domain-containing protein [Kitasatospora sp. RG8]|uniref:DUF2142 domain-containing protein n=1 Tax=Kitasatospora sp. RG8 TaxID=2820815 RepID=UPI001AE00461|nr:DUF2142 domain-containing protein [Kitasatospora sp. RG8]
MMNALKRLADRLATTPGRLWAVSFALFFVLGGSWSMATPIGASPDEHAHIIRAAAVARGQIEGREVMVPHVVADIEGKFAETGVMLPKFYQDLKDVNACYVFKSTVPADCAPKLRDNGGEVQVTTAAGRYNPAYYLVVGWPSLMVSGEGGIYLMRLMSALVCAALLASAVISAAEWRRRSVPLLGVMAAATPMALFMSGMVNPSGPEIAAGILAWSAGLPILMVPDAALLTRRLGRLGIGAIVLISIRPLGLIWFAGALFFALLLQERGALRQVLRRRSAWLWGTAIAAATVGAMAWASQHPDHSVIATPDDLTALKAARITFDNTLIWVHQMIGLFGWLDAPSPAATLLLWSGIVVMLGLLALCFARFREALAIVGALIGIVVIPVAAQANQASTLGLIWQGRYLLPFSVGLPIMATVILARQSWRPGMPWRRLLLLSAFALAFANVAAFVWALRRNAVGTTGSFFLHPAMWAPPGGWPLWVGVYTAAALVLALLVVVTDREEPPQRPVAGEESRGHRGGRGRHRPLAATPADA